MFRVWLSLIVAWSIRGGVKAKFHIEFQGNTILNWEHAYYFCPRHNGSLACVSNDLVDRVISDAQSFVDGVGLIHVWSYNGNCSSTKSINSAVFRVDTTNKTWNYVYRPTDALPFYCLMEEVETTTLETTTASVPTIETTTYNVPTLETTTYSVPTLETTTNSVPTLETTTTSVHTLGTTTTSVPTLETTTTSVQTLETTTTSAAPKKITQPDIKPTESNVRTTTIATKIKPTLPVCCDKTELRGLVWDTTCEDKMVLKKCPGNAKGNASWFCNTIIGNWYPKTPDLSGCRTESVGKLLNSLNTSDIIGTYATFYNAASQANAGGDIIVIADVMKNVTSSLVNDGNLTSAEWLDKVENVTESVADTMNAFLSSSEIWTDLPEKDRVAGAESLMETFQNVGFILIQAMNDTAESFRAIAKDRVLLQALKRKYGYYQEKNLSLPINVATNSDSSLTLISGFENDIPNEYRFNYTYVLFTSLKNMRDVLPVREGSSLPNWTEKTNVNSVVISVSLIENETVSIDLSYDVHFALAHKYLSSDTPVCAFWNFQIKNWDIDGCRILDSNNTHTICACNHLTNFAVLMDLHGVMSTMSESNLRNLKVITFVGCIVSIVSLSICVILTTLIRQLWCIRNIIHRNLSLCLLIAELILITGLDRTRNKRLCSVIAGFLHYFFLASFFWMFLESVYIYILLCKVFQPRRPYSERYYLCGFGLPLVIVALCSISNPKGYGTDTHCWLSAEKGMMWCFGAPVLIIISINLVALLYTLKTALVVSKRATDDKKAAKKWIFGALTLIPLLGLTWGVGYLSWKNSGVVGAYVFTLLNSFQGLAIFIVQVAMNKKGVELLRWAMLRFFKHIRPESRSGTSNRHTSSTSDNQNDVNTRNVSDSVRTNNSNQTNSSEQTTSTYCPGTPITFSKSDNGNHANDLNNTSFVNHEDRHSFTVVHDSSDNAVIENEPVVHRLDGFERENISVV